MKDQTLIIDAEGIVLGRLASFAAKKALEGHTVIVVNTDKTIITGNRADIIEGYSQIRNKGRSHSLKGPHIETSPFKIVKRCIRGMLPNHRWGIGKEALEKIKCYNNLPEEFKQKPLVKLSQQRKTKQISMQELSNQL